MAHWYEPLRSVESLGRNSRRPGSLAGLHQVRQENLAQYFTVEPLARFMWSLATPAITRALRRKPGAKVGLLDNSVGAGRLLQYANPEHHVLGGADVHEPSIRALAEAAGAAGFEREFLAAGMETINPSGYGVSLINPPFSLHLESPLLYPYSCTSWGRFGKGTSAVSHAYAIHQALDASDVALAVVPRSFVAEAREDETLAARLVAVFNVPGEIFAEENARVRVSVLAFGGEEHRGRRVATHTVEDLLASAPDLGLECCNTFETKPRLGSRTLCDTAPVITLPVTGDATVRVVHDGRRIRLGFACGLVQAKVLNAVYHGEVTQDPTKYHRYPRGVVYSGQGKLDLEVHLAQPDPRSSFESLLKGIRAAGGQPAVDAGLLGYFARRIRLVRRDRTPLRHVVNLPTGAAITNAPVLTVTPKLTHVLDSKVWGSPVVIAGEPLKLTLDPDTGRYYIRTIAGVRYDLNREEIEQRFKILDGGGAGGWTVLHEGLPAAFPEIAAGIRARIHATGIDSWLTWAYQLDDLVELAMKPHGAIAAWEMGLGKARLALALCLIAGSRRNLVVVEAGLLDEMLRELAGLPLPADLWQVIRKPEDIRQLHTINLISYERLRSPINPAHARRTYAKLLRRRCAVVVADEGDRMANMASQQTRALWMLSPRKRYVLAGCPIANYPRDVLPLLNYVAGDGTAAQPYGFRRAFLEPRLINSMDFCQRGIDAFREQFVTLEWVTNQFADELSTGAKREVPKIQNLDRFRAVLAPHIKRRVAQEPDCAKVLKVPVPNMRDPHVIEWDAAHLRFYLAVADDFASWYREQRRRSGFSGKQTNLVALLARIQAVRMACTYPQHGVKGFGSYTKLTSKQRTFLDRIGVLTANGHKTIAYVDNPGCVQLLVRELEERGIEGVPFHGHMPPTKRMRGLDRRFRFGPAPVLVATLGVTQKGLNIHQADRVLFLNRAWTAKTEDQAAWRTLRPQQKRPVDVEFFHLRGSIDVYQAQMVAHKGDAAAASIDYAESEYSDVDFVHLDTILGQFCEDLAELHGWERGQLRDRLAVGA